MKATKINGLLIEARNGEQILFDEAGKEIVNLSKYQEMQDLLYNLIQCTCPEEKDPFASACYGWAALLLDQKPHKSWKIDLISGRTIFNSEKKKQLELASPA